MTSALAARSTVLATVLAPVLAVTLTACSTPSLEQDAAVACGWDEPEETVVSAIEATLEQRADNARRASIRFAAAERVAAVDDRFVALVDALRETAEFAAEIETMTPSAIASIPGERWDFAKYTQAAARDQCEQLARVVGRVEQ